MKSRSKELLDKSIAAMVAAIEIYNKPDFQYRAETFAILAVNSWELLLKSKYLMLHNNRIRSLYVFETVKNKDGSISKRQRIKTTRSGNPFTYSLDYIAQKLLDGRHLDKAAYDNIIALVELRDSAIHFYNYSTRMTVRIQEIGTATLKNYVKIIKKWFHRDFSSYNFYLMPLAFSMPEKNVDSLVLNAEEKNFFRYVDVLEENNIKDGEFSVALNMKVSFSRSTSKDDIKVALSQDENAVKIQLTEEQLKAKYPFDYQELTNRCKKRYSGFIVNNDYHAIRKEAESNTRYAHIRYLDPEKPNGPKKIFYSEAIFNVFDRHYQLRGDD